MKDFFFQKNAFRRIEKMISRHRFRRYRRQTESKFEAVALYLWNVALCESLYPALNVFEISLRNATHDALTARFGSKWFMNSNVLTGTRHQEQVQKAILQLRNTGKGHYLGVESNPNFPKEPQRIVAELSLSFWVNLYSNPYSSLVVASVAPDVFPYGPKNVTIEKRQSAIYPRLLDALNLRNRVFHHEPIYHWTLPDARHPNLSERHQSLCDTLRWMCPTQLSLLERADRFPKIHEAGFQSYAEKAESVLLFVEE